MKKDIDIVDPIHHFVRINETEQQLVDHPIFQRLRRIKQLSLAYLVYPGAQHTRFEHSLGVMHIARQAGEHLLENEIIDKSSLDDLSVSALLHDIGHGPFSHTFEHIKNVPSHESMTEEIILKTEIGDILEKYSFNKKQIAKFSTGHSTKNKFLNEIISGFMSADTMDYLLRDGHYTGAEHARVNYTRIIRSLGVYNDKLVLDSSALHSLESIMNSRYQMFQAVYFHKTIRAAEVMLLHIIQITNKYLHLSNLSLDEYLKLDDITLFSQLLTLNKSKSLKPARDMIDAFTNRKLLKLIHESHKISDKHKAQKHFAKKFNIPENEIFIDSVSTSSISLSPLKSEYVTLFTKRGLEQKLDKVRVFSLLPESSSKSINILRVYTTAHHRQKLKL